LAVINVVRCISLYALVPVMYYIGGAQAAIWGIALHGLATVPFVYSFNARIGINNMRRELIVLVVLPIGYVCGATINTLWTQ
jgi:hypothetical protein